MVDDARDVTERVELDAAVAQDVQATFCATLVDQWLDRGVRHAVVAPGSRSTPLALAVAERSEFAVHVVHDERVAGFVALGLAVDTDVPALLLCTSGTAAANFLPAVAEANLSAVPMIV
ncbi:MAG: thiamine pyrophosphate-binding protein, partial [Actinomycetota bacterium]